MWPIPVAGLHAGSSKFRRVAPIAGLPMCSEDLEFLYTKTLPGFIPRQVGPQAVKNRSPSSRLPYTMSTVTFNGRYTDEQALHDEFLKLFPNEEVQIIVGSSAVASTGVAANKIAF